MKSLTFAVSKGGVGKSLITANVGAAIGQKGKKVVLVEGDPNHPLQVILGVDPRDRRFNLDEIVTKDEDIQEAINPTEFDNLFLITSGISLQDYLEINPISFTQKLMTLDTDFMFIDVPFPLGRAAFLSLGLCKYFIPILTEDEFVLCVESAIDTIRLGKHLLKCIPLGFIMNRIKTPNRFTDEFVGDLENLLEIPCLAKINENNKVSKSYGGAGSTKAFLAYENLQTGAFKERIDEVAAFLLSDLPKSQKADILGLIKEVIRPFRF